MEEKTAKPTSKKELFSRYDINESHKDWEHQIDNWYSVEVYRVMHNGELPPNSDHSLKYILDFLDKTKDFNGFMANFMREHPKEWGSYYLTAKRMVYLLSEQILNELNLNNQ